jgi:hypothetical protein
MSKEKNKKISFLLYFISSILKEDWGLDDNVENVENACFSWIYVETF